MSPTLRLCWVCGLAAVCLVPGLRAVAGAEGAPPDPLAQARDLVSQQKYSDAVALLEPLVGEGEQRHSARLLLARCLAGLAQVDKALDLYRSVAAEGSDDLKLSALQAMADIHLTAGDLTEAEGCLTAAAGIYAKAEVMRLKALGSAQYFRTRAEYDGEARFACTQLRRLAEAHEKQGHTAEVTRLCGRLCDEYPEYPDTRAVAVALASLLLRQGQAAEALSRYLQALDTGRDRAFCASALLADNQWYLDAAAQPPARGLVSQALSGLNDCMASLCPSFALVPESLAAFEQAWHEALSRTFEPSGSDWAAIWSALAAEHPRSPWAALCSLAAAQGLLRVGDYEGALARADGVGDLPPSMGELAVQARYLAGLAHMGQVHLTEAESALQGVVASSGGRQLPGLALCRLGEVAEMRLAWEDAGRYYALAAVMPTTRWQRARAQYALKRVAELARMAVPEQPCVRVLPDDRATRGDWPGKYGEERRILCAQNFVLDRIGGRLPPIAYDFSTTDPNEPSRLWVSQKHDEDPAALWDPWHKCHKSANRDDYGEQFPLGEGPDLLLRIAVPEAEHVLSLYFVNDHNYYEPQRAYTISVADAAGTVHAVSHVEDFGGGAYKRFAVSGPTELHIRIWRNLSINTLLSGVFLDPPAAPRP